MVKFNQILKKGCLIAFIIKCLFLKVAKSCVVITEVVIKGVITMIFDWIIVYQRELDSVLLIRQFGVHISDVICNAEIQR